MEEDLSKSMNSIKDEAFDHKNIQFFQAKPSLNHDSPEKINSLDNKNKLENEFSLQNHKDDHHNDENILSVENYKANNMNDHFQLD